MVDQELSFVFLRKQFSSLDDAFGQKDVVLSHKLWFLRRSLLGSCQASVQAVIAAALWDELKRTRHTSASNALHHLYCLSQRRVSWL